MMSPVDALSLLEGCFTLEHLPTVGFRAYQCGEGAGDATTQWFLWGIP